MKILIGVIVSAVAVAAFLANLNDSPAVVAIGLLLTLVFSFFFASVAANAIATTSPVNRSPEVFRKVWLARSAGNIVELVPNGGAQLTRIPAPLE